MRTFLLLALLCLATTGRADVAPLKPSRGKCRAECRQGVRVFCVFPHPGMRGGAVRRCLRVCFHGGDTDTICTMRVFPPGPFGPSSASPDAGGPGPTPSR